MPFERQKRDLPSHKRLFQICFPAHSGSMLHLHLCPTLKTFSLTPFSFLSAHSSSLPMVSESSRLLFFIVGCPVWDVCGRKMRVLVCSVVPFAEMWRHICLTNNQWRRNLPATSEILWFRVSRNDVSGTRPFSRWGTVTSRIKAPCYVPNGLYVHL